MTLDIDEIEKIIKSHMESQPENVVCAECGKLLDYKESVDNYLDISLEVYPCDCIKENKEK